MRWSEKQVAEHEVYNNTFYATEIKDSIAKSKYYAEIKAIEIPHTKAGIIKIEPWDSVTAIEKCWANEARIGVLNFASFTKPGGGYINGSCAQEECLCRESYLYSVLKCFYEYYEAHDKMRNYGLYADRAIYSPDILFKESYYADVITCAAPNYATAQKHVSEEAYKSALYNRIKFVLEIAYQNNITCLILGAYGCGVFGNKPETVASVFLELLKTDYHRAFDKIIFAIPESNRDNNYAIFKQNIQKF